MATREEHISHFPTPRGISRRDLLRLGALAGAAAVGAGVERGIAEASQLFRTSAQLKEVKSGESLPFLREVSSENPDISSNFTDPEFRTVHTVESLDDILMRIRDPKTRLPIKLSFEPEREVVAIFALGEKDLPHSAQIKGAIESGGIIRIIAEEKYPFLPHGRTKDRRIPEKRYSSPFHLVIFPRVTMGGKELLFEFARPTKKPDPYFDAETI